MLAQFPLETGLAKVAKDDFQLEAGTPGWYCGHGREGNSIERHVNGDSSLPSTLSPQQLSDLRQ
jgi:hypothetical protein